MSQTRHEGTEGDHAPEQDTPAEAPVEAEESAAEPAAAEATVESRIAELEARLRVVSAAYHQKVEETAATRERLERQAKLQEEIRRGEVVMAMFEPVENLARSLEASRGLPVEQGLQMVHAQFMEALQKLGLEEVPGVGSTFAPEMHEALQAVPVSDPEQDNKVLQVWARGYRLGSRVIRAAKVVVGSHG